MTASTPRAQQYLAQLRSAAGPIARLLATKGNDVSVKELAGALETTPGDHNFKFALGMAVEEGWYEFGGRGCRRLQRYRVARVCPECGKREFNRLGWMCPVHKKGKDQPNMPLSHLPGPQEPAHN